jgi:hypothetical protein
MIRFLVGGLAFALCVPPALAQTTAAGMRSLPMQFEMRREGPAEVCGEKCRTWVSAIGTITAETPRDFAQFAHRHDLHGATLVLDSGGGSVHGAMALGRKIRQFGMTTTIGKTIEISSPPGDPRAKLSPLANCESMCAFVFLSGTKRIVPNGARLRVHQIWLGDRRDDAAAASYSAEDLVLVQRDIGRLAQYTVEMGGSIDFLELSLRIPPWEPMRVLSRDEIRRMGVATGPETRTPPVAAAATAASAPALTNGSQRAPESAAHGWVMVDQAGLPTLVRSHPLTVEGEDIGSFDLTLACGATPGSLDVGYSEHRTASGISAATLKTVALALGSQDEPLQVVSSALVPRSSEVNSRARGSVPMSFIRLFSELSSRSLVVSTVNASEGRTTIRVGNSGIAASFAELEKNCGSRALHATNTRTGMAPAH